MAFKSLTNSYINGMLKYTDKLARAKVTPLGNAEKDALIKHLEYKLNVFNQSNYIDALKRGELVFVEATTSLPFWSMVVNGKIVTYVNIVNFDVIDPKTKGVKHNFNARSVMALVGAGYTHNRLIDPANYQKYTGNVFLRGALMNAYSRIIVRNIDMLYAITSSPANAKAISMLTNKFFLIHLWGLPADNVNLDNIAFNDGTKSTMTFQSIQTMVKDFPVEAYENINTFITALVNKFNILKGLDTGTLLRNILVKLGEKSLLMIENLPYLAALLTTVTLQGNIVRDLRFTNIIPEKDLNNVVIYFNNTMRRH